MENINLLSGETSKIYSCLQTDSVCNLTWLQKYAPPGTAVGKSHMPLPLSLPIHFCLLSLMGEGLNLLLGQKDKVISLNQGRVNIPLMSHPAQNQDCSYTNWGSPWLPRCVLEEVRAQMPENTFFFLVEGHNLINTAEYFLQHLCIFYH